jgi:S1-C subfamily serine protease
MDKPLFDLLNSCTVHLKVPGGTGTGFFVAPGLILTCAHVVKGAEGDATCLTAHYRKEEYEVQEIVEFVPDPYTDLALLRIDLREHPCVFLDKSVKPPDRLYAYGYVTQSGSGESRTVGQPTTVEYEGETRIDNQRWLKFKGGQIIPGYSGSPLLNMRTWGVCGIVKSTRDRATDLGGGGIPTEVVFFKLPDLAKRNQAFHARDPRWERARAQQEARERRERPLAEAEPMTQRSTNRPKTNESRKGSTGART